MLLAVGVQHPDFDILDAGQQLRAYRRRRRRPIHHAPVKTHQDVVLPVVRDPEHGAARRCDRIRPAAAAHLERELCARIDENTRLPTLSEFLPRRTWVYLRQILGDDAHRELDLAPALGALLRDRLLPYHLR